MTIGATRTRLAPATVGLRAFLVVIVTIGVAGVCGVLGGAAPTVRVAAAQMVSGVDPFAFLGRYVYLDRGDRRDMDERKVVSDTLDTKGREVALFVAGAIDVEPGQLIRKIRDIEALRTGRIVPLVRRFSDPPVLEDLDKLVLVEQDLQAIAECEPGDCGMKLSAPEIDRLQRTIASAGEGWKPAVQREFRLIVLGRVQTYLARGRRDLPDYHDKDEPVSPGTTFSALLTGFDFLREAQPEFVRYLNEFPGMPLEGVESFLYWSIEVYAPKPVITVWQEHILRRTADPGEAEVLVAGTQLFATHYLDGAVSLTVLARDDHDPERRYLTYVSRVSVDVLDGFMAGVRRFFLERRLRSDSRKLFDAQRRRIEEGE